jgi:hypothetical protein
MYTIQLNTCKRVKLEEGITYLQKYNESKNDFFSLVTLSLSELRELFKHKHAFSRDASLHIGAETRIFPNFTETELRIRKAQLNGGVIYFLTKILSGDDSTICMSLDSWELMFQYQDHILNVLARQIEEQQPPVDSQDSPYFSKKNYK